MFPSAPAAGSRTFTGHLQVRLGDVSPKGRLRLDGIARILQDVAVDDATDAAPGEDAFWVVRRTTVRVEQWPRHREDLEVTTWCSGYGRRWALRRTSLVGETGGRVETESLWIHIDPDTGRPTPLGPPFFAHWAEGVTDTSVTARRRLPDAPSEPGHPWTLRFTDFDGLAHVNNAAYLAPVEEELGVRSGPEPPLVAEIEYREGVVRDEPVELIVRDDDGGDGFWLWWVVRNQGRASVRVRSAGQVTV